MIKDIKLETLTDSEKIIYEYLKKNFLKIPVIKIEDIIKETYTSSSSVIRLCKKMGFNGYKIFQNNIIKKFNEFNFIESNDVVLNSTIKTLKMSVLFNKKSKYEKISKIISKSKNIFIYGAGINKPVADILCHQLMMKGINCRSATYSVSETTIIKALKKNDVAIFISYSGSNKKMYEILNTIDPQVITLAITQQDTTKLIKKCKYNLLVPLVNSSYKHFDRIVRLNKLMVVDSLIANIKSRI